jgi:hypothetical protein
MAKTDDQDQVKKKILDRPRDIGDDEEADRPSNRAGVEAIAEELGYPLMALRVLSPDADPFFCGTDRHRQYGEWFAKMFSDYRRPGTPHLRQLHYQMVSADPRPTLPDGQTYQNTVKHSNAMGDASRYARHLGLVDPAAFTDRRNPPPHLYADYGLPPGHCDQPHVRFVDELPRWRLPRVEVTGDTTFSLPAVQAPGYSYSLRDQPVHLELWIEKSTMNDVLIPICERHGVNLVTGVGFQSISGVVQMLQRLDCLPDDRPTRIGYISDFDPAGDCMPSAVAREAEFYLDKFAAGRDVKLTPVALTKDQVGEEGYNLPTIPIKDSDARKDNFEDRRGEGAVELDALEALHPGELTRLVEEFIAPYRDGGLEGRLREAGEEAQTEAERAWAEATRPVREELARVVGEVQTVLAKYDLDLRMINHFLAKDLAPLASQLDAIRNSMGQIVDSNLEVELPPRPEAEAEGRDESGWLFDSTRSYLEQLGAYEAAKGEATKRQRHAGRRAEFDLVCERCGVAFRATKRRKGLAYCGDACRMAAYYQKRKAEAAGRGRPGGGRGRG